jgi:hypothetical protein
MATKLEEFFSDILDSTNRLLEETAPFEHPLLTITRASMKEQKATLEKLIPALVDDEEEAELADVKEEISIVYHNHEIQYPLFRSWRRASDWMNLPSMAAAEKLEPLFEEMKKTLENAAVELENIYGEEEIKFVVPSFYIPTIR